MKQFYLLPTLLLLFLTNLAQAQDNCGKWALGIDLDVLIPYEDLKANGHRSNIGGNVDVFYTGFQQPKLKFYPGFRLRMGGSPMNSRIEPLPDPFFEDASHGVYNFLVDAKFAGRLLIKPVSIVTPFVEADMGVRFSAAYDKYTSIEGESEFDEYTENIVKEISGIYGVGGGFLIRMNESVNLNVSTNFDWTNSMEYVNFDTAFPFDTALTKNAINQRFGIGLFIKIGCFGDDEYESRSRSRTNTRSKNNKRPNIPPPNREGIKN